MTKEVLKFQEFIYLDKPVRTVKIDNQDWFVGKDVCDILEYQNAPDTIDKILDEDEKGVSTIYTLGGNQEMKIINESGLFHLIFQSRKKLAILFRKHVTSVILPAIRSTGSYISEQTKLKQDKIHDLSILIKDKHSDIFQTQKDLYELKKDLKRLEKERETIILNFSQLSLEFKQEIELPEIVEPIKVEEL